MVSPSCFGFFGDGSDPSGTAAAWHQNSGTSLILSKVIYNTTFEWKFCSLVGIKFSDLVTCSSPS
ncbi:hypothetical protein Patl1_02530 [Pistacia atlantica]|uniref:Uncharacterized protein n=1 Tax=Pistacia atlantica TaxID=434234 RepID=A0ACC1C8I5_9ROSI|nr:hypothetical protein Patl1_02530 [Pistacia atlantica]